MIDLKFKHEMIKNKDEYEECEYCIYCGEKLEEEGRNYKACPKKCVMIEFVSLAEYFHEAQRERKRFNKRSSAPSCECKYPLIS